MGLNGYTSAVNPYNATPFNDYMNTVNKYNTGVLYAQTMAPQTSAEQILRQPIVQQGTWPSNTFGR